MPSRRASPEALQQSPVSHCGQGPEALPGPACEALPVYWVLKGQVTCTEAHPTACLGDIEWQFSDGPDGHRRRSSDFLNLEEGFRALAPAVFILPESIMSFPLTLITGIESVANYRADRATPLRDLQHKVFDFPTQEALNWFWAGVVEVGVPGLYAAYREPTYWVRRATSGDYWSETRLWGGQGHATIYTLKEKSRLPGLPEGMIWEMMP